MQNLPKHRLHFPERRRQNARRRVAEVLDAVVVTVDEVLDSYYPKFSAAHSANVPLSIRSCSAGDSSHRKSRPLRSSTSSTVTK